MPHLLDERLDLKLAQFGFKVCDLFRDDAFHDGDLVPACGETVLEVAAQVVAVEEVDARQLANRGIDVARHRDIDEDEGAALATRDHFPHEISVDDQVRATRRADHHVRPLERRRELGHRVGAVPRPRGHFLSARGRAVGHRYLPDLSRSKDLECDRAHLAETDDQHAFVAERTHDAPGQCHSHRTHAPGVSAD
jgi:hypothetical protein